MTTTPPATDSTLILAPGRERSLLRRHPWVFSGGVARIEGAPASGDTVRIADAKGRFLAWAAYCPGSRIAARVYSFDPAARIDDAFFAARIEAALARRRLWALDAPGGAARLVHAESDGLPGLTVDRFGDLLVLQATSAGAHAHRHALAAILARATGARAVYERSEGEALELEGLAAARGPLFGDAPERPIAIEEHGVTYLVDVLSGQKTGFYLDQRDNRALCRTLAPGRDVLDAFCHSAAFATVAAVAGARSVVALDSSEPALALARQNLARNGLADAAVQLERADVFEWLRSARDRAARFDLIVLDPPKFAPTARHVERAARAYKDVNLLAFKLLRPGGLLMSFSCSAAMSPELFHKVVAGAALDARVEARMVRRLGAAPDHAVSLAFPEGDYLKGLLCEVA